MHVFYKKLIYTKLELQRPKLQETEGLHNSKKLVCSRNCIFGVHEIQNFWIDSSSKVPKVIYWGFPIDDFQFHLSVCHMLCYEVGDQCSSRSMFVFTPLQVKGRGGGVQVKVSDFLYLDIFQSLDYAGSGKQKKLNGCWVLTCWSWT